MKFILLRVGLAPNGMVEPSSDFNIDHSRAVLPLRFSLIFMFHVCFVVLSCMFLVVDYLGGGGE